MAAKIRRDDEVIVLTGKDKGKRGKVKNVLSSGKVIVEGINLVKKHQKPVPALNNQAASLKKKLQFRFLTLQSSMRQPARLTV
ncbi:50S ribosomal protein L24 [Klebsiella pneumoniae]|uniref:Large ribosomal subunit protein uL24 n=1 Tax=Klebsiella pneumoniae TaxID=573 RepID=A0A377VAB7_KLEPN|nr:50S ribosomal protein L24 [Klebsiella pneumoniae]